METRLVPLNGLEPADGVQLGLTIPDFVDGEVFVDIDLLRADLARACIRTLTIVDEKLDDGLSEPQGGPVGTAIQAGLAKPPAAKFRWKKRQVIPGVNGDVRYAGSQSCDVQIGVDLDAARRGVNSLRDANQWAVMVDSLLRKTLLFAGRRTLLSVKPFEIDHAMFWTSFFIRAGLVGQASLMQAFLRSTVELHILTWVIAKRSPRGPLSHGGLTFGLPLVDWVRHELEVPRRTYCHVHRSTDNMKTD